MGRRPVRRVRLPGLDRELHTAQAGGRRKPVTHCDKRRNSGVAMRSFQSNWFAAGVGLSIGGTIAIVDGYSIYGVGLLIAGLVCFATAFKKR
jgi:hypothetical protein